MPARIDYTGTCKKMNNDQTATVIEYINSKHMTIQFEDGTIVKDVLKVHYDAGKVANPNFYSNSRIGETAAMSNGQQATIIGYRSAADIDVKFEDNTIVNNVTYARFKSGAIANPTLHKYQARVDACSCIGEARTMNCGLEATCIEYIDSQNITVQFEDGTIVSNRYKTDFYNGEIVSPNLPKYTACRKYDVGTRALMHCGMYCEVIEYISHDDISVRFDDGTIVRHRAVNNFKAGSIQNPNLDIVCNRSHEWNPNSRRPVLTGRLGEENVMTNGMKAKIIRYGGCSDIDIQFENGEIAYNRSYGHFSSGRVALPSESTIYVTPDMRIGESKIMKNGMKATIIGYENGRNVDIQFEDGYISRNKEYIAFCIGDIKNPNLPNTRLNDRTGEVGIMNNGIAAKIIRYGTGVDIDVEFDDGTVVKNKNYSDFKRGNIAHPCFRSSLPQQYCYYMLSKYIPDIQYNIRPNWLRNTKSGRSYELDMYFYFGTMKVGIEYDGCGNRQHLEENNSSKNKYDLISSVLEDDKKPLDYLIQICEAGTISYSHKSDKIIHYGLSKSSSNGYKDYGLLMKELSVVLEEILIWLGYSKESISVSPSEIDPDYENFNYFRFCEKFKELVFDTENIEF